MSKATFKKSAFDLKRWSIPLGWISVCWLVATSLIFVLPTRLDEQQHITLDNFNWTIAVFGIIIVMALVYWYLPAPYGARHFFTGPKRAEEEALITGETKSKGVGNYDDDT